MYYFFYNNEFSNFHHAEFESEGKQFHNSEQYFMYCKAITFNDTETANKILKRGYNPSVAKSLGRTVRNYDNDIWDSVRFDVMYKANKLKYDSNPRLKGLLLSHGDDTFVEASPTDIIWGIGIGMRDASKSDPKNWRGQNLLGQVLTKLRDEYIKKGG